MSGYTFAEIRERLGVALQQLYLLDRYLIEQRISEFAIAHRLAIYLEHLFPRWQIDCEYNKYGDDPKAPGKSGICKRPDIIVHQRGETGPNLLVLEIKKQPQIDQIDQTDREKITKFINKLHYQWGACISISEQECTIEWQGRDAPHGTYEKLKGTDVKELGV